MRFSRGLPQVIAALALAVAATPALALYTGVAISGGNAQEISTMTITLPGKDPVPVRPSKTNDQRKLRAWFIDAPYRMGVGETATVTITDASGTVRSAPIQMGVTQFTIDLDALFGSLHHTPLDGLASGILPVINRARTEPTAYAPTLRGPGDPAEVREAIAFVMNHQPEPPLTESAALDAAAARHAADLGAHGLTGHFGSDGSSPADRIHAVNIWSTIVAEEVAIGQTTPAAVVRQWMIDHLLPQRYHRIDLFHPLLAFLGAGCAPHETMGTVCVIDMTSTPMDRGPAAGATAFDCGGEFYDAAGKETRAPRSPHSESSEDTLRRWKQSVIDFYSTAYTSPSRARLSPDKAMLCTNWRVAREIRADDTIAKSLEALQKEGAAGAADSPAKPH
jgi:hypothetical protein